MYVSLFLLWLHFLKFFTRRRFYVSCSLELFLISKTSCFPHHWFSWKNETILMLFCSFNQITRKAYVLTIISLSIARMSQEIHVFFFNWMFKTSQIIFILCEEIFLYVVRYFEVLSDSLHWIFTEVSNNFTWIKQLIISSECVEI